MVKELKEEMTENGTNLSDEERTELKVRYVTTLTEEKLQFPCEFERSRDRTTLKIKFKSHYQGKKVYNKSSLIKEEIKIGERNRY